MSIVVGENSYITIIEADDLLEFEFDVTTWEDSTDISKEKALRLATRRVDSLFLQGYKYSVDQLLKFPRNITREDLNDEVGVVPDIVKQAVAIESSYILNNEDNMIENLKKHGVKSQSIQGTSYSLDQGSMDYNRKKTNDLSKETTMLLKSYIQTSFSRR